MFISVAFKRYRSDDESCEGTNTEDPAVDFEREVNRLEVEEEEGMQFPPKLERMVAQEDREVKLYQEETTVVNLGVGYEKKEVKVGTSMTTPIRDELVVLLRNYKDVFAWSYQDMLGLNPNIVQHRFPLKPKCSPVKQKLWRMKPKMSLKLKRN